MQIATVKHGNVQGDAAVHGEAAQKFFQQLQRKMTADRFVQMRRDRVGQFVAEKGPAAQIECYPTQRFVHRQQKMAVTDQSGLIPDRLRQRLPQHDPGVLDGVMRIHRDVAIRLQPQIGQAMPR